MSGLKRMDITEISGIRIGHAQDREGGTGCTVILCEAGATAGVDVRGGGPASRETELLSPIHMMEKIQAVMLSGGSAYGLDAGAGAMRYLEERGFGFDVQIGVVPIVCGASLFDLVVGDPHCRPDQEMGYQACLNASSHPPEEGNVGAGTGASVGKFLGPERMMKSGLGTAGFQAGDLKVAAIAAVNALGDVTDAESGVRLAGLLSEDHTRILNTEEAIFEQYARKESVFQGNTTLGCIVTNAKLTKAQVNKVASMAHNGLAQTIHPVHTSADGDTIFALATEEVDAMPDAVGTIAVKAMACAVERAVRTARPAYGLKAACDFE